MVGKRWHPEPFGDLPFVIIDLPRSPFEVEPPRIATAVSRAAVSRRERVLRFFPSSATRYRRCRRRHHRLRPWTICVMKSDGKSDGDFLRSLLVVLEK